MEKEQEKFDWPKKAVLELISLWQQYECLYNPKHKFYHNRHSRFAALNEIVENLKSFSTAIGVADVKNKMSYLRGQFTREIAKIKERNREGAEEVYIPSAYWFSDLSFLEDFVKMRKESCNLYTQNIVQVDDFWEPSQPFESDTSPQPSKRSRIINDTPQTSRTMSQEDSELIAATAALQNNVSTSKKISCNEKDEAFLNYVKTELAEITNVNIKDRLIENIAQIVFAAKKEQRLFNEQNDKTSFNFEAD